MAQLQTTRAVISQTATCQLKSSAGGHCGPSLNLCLGKSGAAGLTEALKTLHQISPPPPNPPTSTLYLRLSISAVPESDTSRKRERLSGASRAQVQRAGTWSSPLHVEGFQLPLSKSTFGQLQRPSGLRGAKGCTTKPAGPPDVAGREIMKGLKGHTMGVMGGDRKHDHC